MLFGGRNNLPAMGFSLDVPHQRPDRPVPAALPVSWRAAVILLAALTLAIYLGSARTPALFDDADAGHAEVPKEILERGDWVTFHINGVRYLEKAPLLFWTAAIAYRFLGTNEMAARLPIVLSVLGLVLVGAAFGRRGGGDRAGLYTGLVLASSFGVYLFTRIFIADILLTFCIAAALYCFWRCRGDPVWSPRIARPRSRASRRGDGRP
jgi:4-amino-4-deoxy-L-arabinose transferase-like glycosyltransferase